MQILRERFEYLVTATSKVFEVTSMHKSLLFICQYKQYIFGTFCEAISSMFATACSLFLDNNQIVKRYNCIMWYMFMTFQGRQNRSGWSGFGWTTFPESFKYFPANQKTNAWQTNINISYTNVNDIN